MKLYVGTYTQHLPFVDGKGAGIYIYEFDAEAGTLRHQTTVTGPGTISPSFLTTVPTTGCLYAVNEIASGFGPHGTVSAFAADPDSGALSFLNQVSCNGWAPCHLAADSTGRHVLVANYESGNVSVHPLAADGRVETASDVLQMQGTGPNAQRQEGPHAHMVLPGDDGRTIFVADLGTDKLMHFTLENGKLTPGSPPWGLLPAGAGPRHLVRHPQLPLFYVLNELDSTVTILHMDTVRGSFSQRETLSLLPPGFSGQSSGAEIEMDATGRFLYASNRGHESIATFSVEPETGTLNLLDHTPTQGKSPRHFIIAPGGRWLLVANQDSDTIVTFARDKESGRLDPTAQIIDVPTPVCLHFPNSRSKS